MANEPTKVNPTKRQQIVSAVLWFLLAVAVIFAAYQIRVFILNRQASQMPAVSPSTYSGGEESLTTSNTSDTFSQPATLPTELLGQAASGAKLEPFQGDPAGIAPPPHAQGGAGFIQDFAGAVTTGRTYYVHASHDFVRDYYINTLKSRGFALKSEESAGQDSRLIFIKGAVHVTISLRSMDEKDKNIRITVTAIRPSADK